MLRLLLVLCVLCVLAPLPGLAAKLQLSAGGGVSTRRFFWVDPVLGDLRGYRAHAYPVVSISADLAAHEDPTFGDLGLAASLATSAGLRSETSDGESLATRQLQLEVTPRLRLVPWGKGATSFTVLGGFGLRSFELAGGVRGEVPAFAYRYVRLGGELRVPAGPVALLGSGAYLAVLSSGPLADRFRDHVARGVDGAAGVALPLSPSLELRALATYTHFAHAMHPAPGDPYVAGGALDQYLGGTAQLVVRP